MDDELLSQIFAEIGEIKGIMTGVRDELKNGRERFKDIEEREANRCKEMDKRIGEIEQQQQWMGGKLAAFVMAIGAGVTLSIHLIIWIADKIGFGHS